MAFNFLFWKGKYGIIYAEIRNTLPHFKNNFKSGYDKASPDNFVFSETNLSIILEQKVNKVSNYFMPYHSSKERVIRFENRGGKWSRLISLRILLMFCKVKSIISCLLAEIINILF